MTSAEHALYDMLKAVLDEASLKAAFDGEYTISVATFVEGRKLIEKIQRGHYQ